MVQPSPPLRKTPLNAWHRANGAEMFESDGWDMPHRYGDAAAEHLAVRERAGLFDLGDTGLIEIAGADALAAVQWLTSNDAGALRTGQVQHTALTTPVGTFLDEAMVYRLSANHFLMTVNPGNLKKDVASILAEAKRFADLAVVDTSSRYAMLSLQGPAALEILQPLTGADLQALPDCAFTFGEVAGARATISSTTCSGEVGFDILVPPPVAPKAWQALLREGGDLGLVPAGLAALDTLRLEAGWRLYGAEIDETTTVLEADLESIVAWDKGEFRGRAALAALKAAGLGRRLVGFEMVERAVAARGRDVFVNGVKAGAVTSGADAPFVKKAIGMAYLPVAHAEAGTECEIDVGGHRAAARVVPLPFYTRPER
jgi:aminomethyltransferase